MGIGLSIVAFVMDGDGMTILGLCLLLATLGVCCVSCGGFDVSSKVTCLLSVVVFGCTMFAVVGTLLSSLSIFCSTLICSLPFMFLLSISACVRSLSAFIIVSSGIKVGCVMYLCLKCTLSGNISLFILMLLT